jgi:hypothetical protein
MTPSTVVPNQQQRRHAPGCKPLAAIGQELGGDHAHGTSIDKPQPEFVYGWQEQAVGGQGLGIGIMRGDRLFDEPDWLIRPGLERRLLHARPPGLIAEAECPVGMPCSQPDQPVASPFFRSYSRSGLVIQRLARFQEVPNRMIACRMVSSLTRRPVRPCRKLSSASRSSVQTLVGWPKSRGLRWASACRCAKPVASTLVWMVWLRCERACSTSLPRWLKAWIVLRTVCKAQPSCRAIGRAQGCLQDIALGVREWTHIQGRLHPLSSHTIHYGTALGRRWDSMSVGINERSQSQIAPVMDSTSPRVHRVTEILPPAPELIRKPRGL